MQTIKTKNRKCRTQKEIWLKRDLAEYLKFLPKKANTPKHPRLKQNRPLILKKRQSPTAGLTRTENRLNNPTNLYEKYRKDTKMKKHEQETKPSRFVVS